jgi:hypothetical protein
VERENEDGLGVAAGAGDDVIGRTVAEMASILLDWELQHTSAGTKPQPSVEALLSLAGC